MIHSDPPLKRYSTTPSPRNGDSLKLTKPFTQASNVQRHRLLLNQFEQKIIGEKRNHRFAARKFRQQKPWEKASTPSVSVELSNRFHLRFCVMTYQACIVIRINCWSLPEQGDANSETKILSENCNEMSLCGARNARFNKSDRGVSNYPVHVQALMCLILSLYELTTKSIGGCQSHSARTIRLGRLAEDY